MKSGSEAATGSLCILVLGPMVRVPLGGMAWHYLNYLLGLRQLGHDVYFLEDSDDTPYSCYDPDRHVTDTNPRYGLRFAARVLAAAGLGDRWAYYDAHEAKWHGPVGNQIRALGRRADLLLNISAANPLRHGWEEIPRRVLIDTDPAFTQVRHLTEPARRARAYQHTAWFTFGENIPTGQSAVPADGLAWQPTRQPVCLEAWPCSLPPSSGKLTTVMQWKSYNPRHYQGRDYLVKSHSFKPYAGLPQKVGPLFELALGDSHEAIDWLVGQGWGVVDPLDVTRTPERYQAFIQESRGEFTVAKGGYVTGRTGWFSERSACYLATGRPVVVQDTGFGDWLRVTEGVLRFATPEEAAAQIQQLNERYVAHCKAARAVAETYFDSRRVLSTLLDRIFTTAGVS